jgi:surface polysaccharide O-acyltransferase-like enzyme
MTRTPADYQYSQSDSKHMVLTSATFLAAVGLALIGLPLYRNNQDEEGKEHYLYVGATALILSAAAILILMTQVG